MPSGRPRVYGPMQIEVLREGSDAGLTCQEAARYAGINPRYAQELSRRLRIPWPDARPRFPEAEARLAGMMAALSAQPLVQTLARLAAESRLFSPPPKGLST